MGRQQHLRNERRAQRKAEARAAGQGLQLPRVDLAVLDRGIYAVSSIFGTEARCVNAAALMQELGRHLGYKFEPRQVSLVASSLRTGNSALLGVKAVTTASLEDLSTAQDRRPEGENTGHVILTSDDPGLVVDANLGQLAPFGIDIPMLRRRADPHPQGGEWQWTNEELGIKLHYMLDEDHYGLLEHFDSEVLTWTPAAVQIAGKLREGIGAKELVAELRQLDRSHFTDGDR